MRRHTSRKRYGVASQQRLRPRRFDSIVKRVPKLRFEPVSFLFLVCFSKIAIVIFYEIALLWTVFDELMAQRNYSNPAVGKQSYEQKRIDMGLWSQEHAQEQEHAARGHLVVGQRSREENAEAIAAAYGNSAGTASRNMEGEYEL